MSQAKHLRHLDGSFFRSERGDEAMEERKHTILTLKFIGIDDFACPTYQDQYGRFWKDQNLGKSENPDVYSVTVNDPDGEPQSPIQQEHTFDPKPFRRSLYEFQYMMLGRLQSDCEYYLGYGRRSLSILSGKDPRHHINRMKELWQEFPEDEKPEWLTWEQLLEYEKEMCINPPVSEKSC